MLLVVLRLSTYSYVVNIFRRTDEGTSDKQSAWRVGRAGYDTTNDGPVVRAHHSRQGYRVFRPFLHTLECPASNKRTGTSVDDRGPLVFHTWYVPGTVKN